MRNSVFSRFVANMFRIKNYRSDIDIFLEKLDENSDSWSDSRNAEVEKYKRIFALRDGKMNMTRRINLHESQ